MAIGTGISSAPVISLKPAAERTTPDLYVTTSGGGGTGAQTQRVNINPPGAANRTNMLYWKDKRVESRPLLSGMSPFSEKGDIPRPGDAPFSVINFLDFKSVSR